VSWKLTTEVDSKRSDMTQRTESRCIISQRATTASIQWRR